MSLEGLLPTAPPFAGLPFLVAVAAGQVKGWRIVHKFGRNGDIGVTTEDLWEAGGLLVWPTAQALGSIVSTDANDTAAGTGARSVYIEGLDINYAEVSETRDLNGQTPVNTINQYYRINLLEVDDAGASEENAGVVTISLGGNVQRYIEPGDSVDHGSHYTLPAGMQGFLIDVSSWQGKDATQDVAFWHRHNESVWHKHYHVLSYQGAVDLAAHFTDGFAGGDDVKMTSVKDGAAGSNINSAGLYTLLVKER